MINRFARILSWTWKSIERNLVENSMGYNFCLEAWADLKRIWNYWALKIGEKIWNWDSVKPENFDKISNSQCSQILNRTWKLVKINTIEETKGFKLYFWSLGKFLIVLDLQRSKLWGKVLKTEVQLRAEIGWSLGEFFSKIFHRSWNLAKIKVGEITRVYNFR